MVTEVNNSFLIRASREIRGFYFLSSIKLGRLPPLMHVRFDQPIIHILNGCHRLG